jgi:hypothetical protein
MRLWTFLVLLVFLAIGFTLSRDPVGRVAVIVFVTGLIELAIGTTAIMTLFRTVGAIGRAESPAAYMQAVASTAMVVLVASIIMVGLLYVSILLLKASVP